MGKFERNSAKCCDDVTQVKLINPILANGLDDGQ